MSQPAETILMQQVEHIKGVSHSCLRETEIYLDASVDTLNEFGVQSSVQQDGAELLLGNISVYLEHSGHHITCELWTVLGKLRSINFNEPIVFFRNNTNIIVSSCKVYSNKEIGVAAYSLIEEYMPKDFRELSVIGYCYRGWKVMAMNEIRLVVTDDFDIFPLASKENSGVLGIVRDQNRVLNDKLCFVNYEGTLVEDLEPTLYKSIQKVARAWDHCS